MLQREPYGYYGSGHINIFAWSEQESDVGKTRTEREIKNLKLDFSGPSGNPWENFSISQTTDIEIEYLQNCKLTKANVVVLDSEVSFKEFSKKLYESKFSDNNNFRVSNNCVHAALFALEAAGIKLNITEQRSCKYLFCCFFLYTDIMKPIELLNAAKAYKDSINSEKENTFLLSPSNS